MSHPIVHTPAFAFLSETKENEAGNEKSRVREIVAAIEREATNPPPQGAETVKVARNILEIPIPFEPSDPVLCCLTAYYVEIMRWRSIDCTKRNGCNLILLTK